MTPQERRERLHRLLDLMLDIQDSGAGLAFFRYAGHVDGVSIEIDSPDRTNWRDQQERVYDTGLLILREPLVEPEYLDAAASALAQLNRVKEAA